MTLSKLLPEACDLFFNPVKELKPFFLAGAADLGCLVQEVAQVVFSLKAERLLDSAEYVQGIMVNEDGALVIHFEKKGIVCDQDFILKQVEGFIAVWI